MSISLLHALADHLELTRIYHYYSLHQPFNRLAKVPRVAGRFDGYLVVGSQRRLELRQLFQIKRAHHFAALLAQITNRQTVRVQVYSNESHLRFPPVISWSRLSVAAVTSLLFRVKSPTVALRSEV